MEPFVLRAEQYFLIEDWTGKNDGLIAGFTTKNGGYSREDYLSLNFGFHVGDHSKEVCLNRSLLADKIDFPLKEWVGAEQTHDVNIAKVGKKDIGKGANSYDDAFKQTDGFFTYDKGVLLTLCYADCVPLYFYAPKEKAIGIAHAGWKGSVNGIGQEMIDVFKKEGIKPESILAVIGPSICEKCYIVDDRVITKVQNVLEDVDEKPYNLISGNQYYLDLRELNKQIFLKSGLLNENIRITNYCTSCHKDYFFSHRRDQGKTGRMMSFIGWKEDIQQENES